MEALSRSHQRLLQSLDRLNTIVIETTFEELLKFMQTLPDDQIISEELKAKAAADIDTERERQINVEQWDEEHDDAHVDGSLWRAAYFYANLATKPAVWAYANFKQWPWSPEWFKPWSKNSATSEIDRERCLVKAGALILAEQERLDRALQKVINKLAEIQNPKDK